MPNRIPILPNSIFKDQVPPHLRKKEIIEGLGTYEIEELKAGLDTELLQALVYFDFLVSNQKIIVKNDGFRGSYSATIGITNLNAPSNWYEFPLTKDISSSTFVNNKYVAPYSGRYFVSGKTFVIFEPGEIEDYVNLYWSGDVTDETYRLAIFKNDTQDSLLATQFARSFHSADSNKFYHNQISLSGSDMIYLNRGDKLDLRINLFNYTYVKNPYLIVTTEFSIFFITDTEK